MMFNIFNFRSTEYKKFEENYKNSDKNSAFMSVVGCSLHFTKQNSH